MMAFTSTPRRPSELIWAEGLPRMVELSFERLSPLDAHLGTNGCVLPWALLFNVSLDAGLARASLAKTLALWPELAGRMRPPPRRCACTTKRDWHISLCNKGAVFSEHTASGVSAADLLRSGAFSSRRGFSFSLAAHRRNGAGSLPSWMEVRACCKELARHML